jgi:hypothetical protein
MKRLLPDTLLLPGLETLMNHATGDTKPISVNSFPLTACPQDVPDAVECSPITGPWTSSPTLSGSLRKVFLHSAPQLPGHLEEVDIPGFLDTIPFQGVSSLSMGLLILHV